jgi:hypothetical protein
MSSDMPKQTDRDSTVVYVRIPNALKDQIDAAIKKVNRQHPTQSAVTISRFIADAARKESERVLR